MHGLINKGIRNLVITHHGVEVWRKIKKEAGINDMVLISMENYEDKLTFRIVEVTAKILGKTGSEILNEFGKFWVTYISEQGFGDLIKLAGRNFPEFMSNLNNIHLRMGSTYQGICPPSFTSTTIDDSTMKLEYFSSRKGLAPFLMGVFIGLGKLFKLKIDVSQIEEENKTIELHGDLPEQMCPRSISHPKLPCQVSRLKYYHQFIIKYYPIENDLVENNSNHTQKVKSFAGTCPFK